MNHVYVAFIHGKSADFAFLSREDAIAWVARDAFVRSYKAIPVYQSFNPVPDLG